MYDMYYMVFTTRFFVCIVILLEKGCSRADFIMAARFSRNLIAKDLYIVERGVGYVV